MNILFIEGIPDHRKVKVVRVHPLSGDLQYRYGGNCPLYLHIKHAGWKRQRIVLDTRPLAMGFESVHCVVNQIANPDLCQITLEHLSTLMQEHPDTPVFNAPQQVFKTRKDRVYETLQDVDGITLPKTLRITPHSPEDIRKAIESHTGYPAQVTPCNTYEGHPIALESPKNLLELHAFPLDGRDYYLTQKIEASEIQRIVLVQGQALQPTHKCFQKIHQRIPLDLMAIEYARLPDGQLLITNVSADIPLPESTEPIVKAIEKKATHV